MPRRIEVIRCVLMLFEGDLFGWFGNILLNTFPRGWPRGFVSVTLDKVSLSFYFF